MRIVQLHKNVLLQTINVLCHMHNTTYHTHHFSPIKSKKKHHFPYISLNLCIIIFSVLLTDTTAAKELKAIQHMHTFRNSTANCVSYIGLHNILYQSTVCKYTFITYLHSHSHSHSNRISIASSSIQYHNQQNEFCFFIIRFPSLSLYLSLMFCFYQVVRIFIGKFSQGFQKGGYFSFNVGIYNLGFQCVAI